LNLLSAALAAGKKRTKAQLGFNVELAVAPGLGRNPSAGNLTPSLGTLTMAPSLLLPPSLMSIRSHRNCQRRETRIEGKYNGQTD
jgi:hypothetical protein